MRSMESDTGPRLGATVVRRVTPKGPEFVIVCERCTDVHVLDVDEAMSVALALYLQRHDEDPLVGHGPVRT